jgi:non-ribosomal peptide synthetase component E (peptide arylation enzyme)
MTQNQYYLYTAILVVIIFALSVGVSFYYMKLKKINAQREKEIAHYVKKEQERIAFVKDSLKTISMAFLQKQCEASEACIRLRMLIDRVEFVSNEDYPVIFEMYEEIRHFKTHEARNAMTAKDKFEEDKQRFAIEDKHMDNLKTECEQLINKLAAH